MAREADPREYHDDACPVFQEQAAYRVGFAAGVEAAAKDCDSEARACRRYKQGGKADALERQAIRIRALSPADAGDTGGCGVTTSGKLDPLATDRGRPAPTPVRTGARGVRGEPLGPWADADAEWTRREIAENRRSQAPESRTQESGEPE
jgi:hypothetical protein